MNDLGLSGRRSSRNPHRSAVRLATDVDHPIDSSSLEDREGIEPPCPGLQPGASATQPSIHWRRVKESNPWLSHHPGFQDQLPTIERHSPMRMRSAISGASIIYNWTIAVVESRRRRYTTLNVVSSGPDWDRTSGLRRGQIYSLLSGQSLTRPVVPTEGLEPSPSRSGGERTSFMLRRLGGGDRTRTCARTGLEAAALPLSYTPSKGAQPRQSAARHRAGADAIEQRLRGKAGARRTWRG